MKSRKPTIPIYIAAPGHPYNPKTGTGIEVTASHIKLWGVTAPYECFCEVENPQLSATEFFGRLLYGNIFPNINYWWFESHQAQMITVSIEATFYFGCTGKLTFTEPFSGTADWRVTTDLVTFDHEVLLTLPKGQPAINLPFLIALSQLILSVIQGDIAQGQEILVSSLVSVNDLSTAFPDTPYFQQSQSGECYCLALTNRERIRTWWLKTYGLLR